MRLISSEVYSLDTLHPERLQTYSVFLKLIVRNSIFNISIVMNLCFIFAIRDHLGRDHMVVGFTTTCAISAYHH